MMPDNQVIKSLSSEFDLSGLEEKDFITGLADTINYLIQNDFSRLVQILYRKDVSETKLRKMLAGHPDEDAGLIIGQLLIEREKKRMESREGFKRNDNVSDDEKW
jgi:hypothetical protein